MKKTLNKKIAILGAITIFIIALIIIAIKIFSIDNKEKPISYTQVSYVIDVYDLRQIVGHADYVFIGFVEEELNTVYKHEAKSPYTNYSVTVLENIKGELIMDNPILIQKSGGLSKNKRYYEVPADDFLPIAGEFYIFSVHEQENGELLLAGINSNIAIPSNMSFDDIKEVQEIKEAYENEIVDYFVY